MTKLNLNASSEPVATVHSAWLVMNVFRLIGDLLHLFSIVVLLLKIYTTKKCNGVAGVSLQSRLVCFGV